MAEFRVDENFQFGGALRVVDSFLEVADHRVIDEMALGEHEETGKKVSGLLNHCSPADDHTRDLVAGEVKPRPTDVEAQTAEAEKAKEKEINRLRGEFKKLGKAYNPKWAMDKLQKELKIAKRLAAEETPEPKKKTEKI